MEIQYSVTWAALIDSLYLRSSTKLSKILSVTRILRATFTKCVCNYSSQTTEPNCIKIIPANRASYADYIGYLDLKYLPHHNYLKTQNLISGAP